MKKTIIIASLFLYANVMFAQNENIETEIKNLEQAEVKALQDKDTTTIKKLWDKDFIVHNPENKIVLAKPNLLDRPVIQNTRVSFTREVEKVLVNGDIAISMGNETVVPADGSNQGQTIRRSYTNIWMKKDGSWKIIARHANIICQ
ncbi:MAG: nuclear transport factor 2 family protein [Chitinophagaceae bacterium]